MAKCEKDLAVAQKKVDQAREALKKHALGKSKEDLAVEASYQQLKEAYRASFTEGKLPHFTKGVSIFKARVLATQAHIKKVSELHGQLKRSEQQLLSNQAGPTAKT